MFILSLCRLVFQGQPKLNLQQQQAHLPLGASPKSPLIISADMRKAHTTQDRLPFLDVAGSDDEPHTHCCSPSCCVMLYVFAVQIGLPGSTNLNLQQQQAHFALWSIMKSPLIIGADMRKLTPEQIAILQNPEVIAMNQDPLGIPGDLIWKEGAEEVIAPPVPVRLRTNVMNQFSYFFGVPVNKLKRSH